MIDQIVYRLYLMLTTYVKTVGSDDCIIDGFCLSDHFTSKPLCRTHCGLTEGPTNSVTAKSHISPSPPSPSSLFHITVYRITYSDCYAVNGPTISDHPWLASWDLLSNSWAQVGNGKSLGNLEGVSSRGRHMYLSRKS